MCNTSRAESEECKIPPYEFEMSENILLLNKMYNFYVGEDAHLAVNGLTARKRNVQHLPIAQRMFDLAAAPVQRQMFKLHFFAIV